jgi:cleavage and polyadenylation specificity factor subunit 2
MRFFVLGACVGNVLLPVDAAGRLLELALLLERAWERGGLPYALVLLGPMGRNVLAFAGSQLEWMADGLARALESARTNPFALRCAA